MAAASVSLLENEDMLRILWMVLGCSLLLMALVILYRTTWNQSPRSILLGTTSAIKQVLEELWERPLRSERDDRLEVLVIEERQKRWASFASYLISTPFSGLQPVALAVEAFYFSAYMPSNLIMMVPMMAGMIVTGVFLIADMSSGELRGRLLDCVFAFIYATFAVLPAVASTLQQYALLRPCTILVHGWLVQLAPSAQLLLLVETLNLGLSCWMVWSSPWQEGFRFPHLLLSFTSFAFDLMISFGRESSVLDLVKSTLQAEEEAEQKASELLAMMTDAVVSLDHAMALRQASPKLSTLLFRPSVQAGTLLRQLLMPSEGDRVTQFLARDTPKAQQLLTDFQDSDGRRIPVRMYHISFKSAKAETPQHLLGLVEENHARESAPPSPVRVRESKQGQGESFQQAQHLLQHFVGSLEKDSQSDATSISGEHVGGRILQNSLEALQGDWVGCEEGVEETFSISGTSAKRIFWSRLGVRAAGMRLLKVGEELHLRLKGEKARTLLYRQTGAGLSSSSSAPFAAFEGTWASEDPSAPSLEVDDGRLKVGQTLQLDDSWAVGIRLAGNWLSMCSQRLYWRDPFLSSTRAYRRAAEPGVASPITRRAAASSQGSGRSPTRRKRQENTFVSAPVRRTTQNPDSELD